jgi:hypothetical protein
MDRFKVRIPFFSELGFEKVDKTRFAWNLLIERPKENSMAAVYEQIMTHINEYIQLMIKMSASMNDESVNQVKNIGLSQDFCLFMVRRKEAHPKLKASLLELYVKLHMNVSQRISEADNCSFR